LLWFAKAKSAFAEVSKGREALCGGKGAEAPCVCRAELCGQNAFRVWLDERRVIVQSFGVYD